MSLCGALALVACGSSRSQSSNEPTSAPTTAPADVAEPVAPNREQRVAEAVTRIGGISDEVAVLRGLPFKADVPAEYQTQDNFRVYVKSELERELPVAESALQSRIAQHLGLVPGPVDLAKVLEDAFVSQAGAYYDPMQKKFFFLMVDDPTTLDTMAAHELVHAIQDQHFDLLRYYGQRGASNAEELTSDEANARRFVVEGEATLIMLAYAPRAATGNAQLNLLDAQYENQMRMTLGVLGAVDAAAMASQQSEMLAKLELSDDMAAAAEAMKDIPLFILVPLMESYTKGATTAYEVFRAGGWEAVAALYSEPPQSTEQVLHPREKLVGKRDYPVALTIPTPKVLESWQHLDTEVLGELGWRVYLQTWDVEDATEAAAGWDGDLYAVYGKQDATVALLATVWDTAKDAQQFFDGYVASLRKRFPEAAIKTNSATTRLTRPDGTELLVKRQAKQVWIVDGAPKGQGPALMSAMGRTKQQRDPREASGKKP